MTQQEKGQFVQVPLQMIYDCPDLNRDDKWVLISIMGKCWTRGPHRLSYRDIQALSGVPISLLSSFDDKKTGHHEGIIDRLVRIGFIRIDLGKDVNPSTGKPKGNAKTFIYINYDLLWELNISYCKTRNLSQAVFTVKQEDYEPVSNTNKVVSHTNGFISQPVSNVNGLVQYENNPVSTSSTNDDTYILQITQIDSDTLDSLGVSAIASTSQTQFKNPLDIAFPVVNGYKKQSDGDISSPEQPFPVALNQAQLSNEPRAQSLPLVVASTVEVGDQGDTRPMANSQHALPVPSADLPSSHPTQQATHAPVASVPPDREQRGAGETQEKPKRIRAVKIIPIGPPVTPTPDVKWSAEVAVEIVEAKKGRRYGETTRAQELTEARKVLKLEFNDAPITREQFEQAWDDMTAWPFWKEHTNVKPMIKTLRKDDKIIALLEELAVKSRKSNGNSKPTLPQSNGSMPASLQVLDDYTYAEPPLVLPKAHQVARRFG